MAPQMCHHVRSGNFRAGEAAQIVPISSNAPSTGRLTICKQLDNFAVRRGALKNAIDVLMANGWPLLIPGGGAGRRGLRAVLAGSVEIAALGVPATGHPRGLVAAILAATGLVPGEGGGRVAAAATVEGQLRLRACWNSAAPAATVRRAARSHPLTSGRRGHCCLRGCAARPPICDEISLQCRTTPRTRRRDQQCVHGCEGNSAHPVSVSAHVPDRRRWPRPVPAHAVWTP